MLGIPCLSTELRKRAPPSPSALPPPNDAGICYHSLSCVFVRADIRDTVYCVSLLCRWGRKLTCQNCAAAFAVVASALGAARLLLHLHLAEQQLTNDLSGFEICPRQQQQQLNGKKCFPPALALASAISRLSLDFRGGNKSSLHFFFRSF